MFSYKPMPGAEEAIYRLISDITISMKGGDYLKLPELVMNEVPVRLSEKEMEYVDALKRDLVLSLKEREISIKAVRFYVLFTAGTCDALT